MLNDEAKLVWSSHLLNVTKQHWGMNVVSSSDNREGSHHGLAGWKVRPTWLCFTLSTGCLQNGNNKTSVVSTWRSWNPHTLLVGKQNGAMENSMEVPKNRKLELPYHPAIALLGNYPKKLKSGSWRHISTPWFTEALFTIAKMWEQRKCPSTEDWRKKMWWIQ